ncbi:unnamed protein product [Aspergillus oryzae RIB40]|uniref:DNA, SC012 n=1 Tax=Aspergillus oryzae (strain ATCC 42149 / RIB 40) TaxID=510516 RepID=Q2UC49_ASPOR|nr:unnamed protein product [Aspergillus oryzae RIB40]BAE60866.1 unnamed protein product [Aspergillus oryzae RIB40]
MPPTKSISVSLHPALPTDAPTLDEIHSKAFPNDLLLEVMYGPREENTVGLAQDLEKAIRENPNARFTKAVDDESGRVVGWSWWIIYRDAEAHVKAEQEAVKKRATPPPRSICPRACLEYRQLVVEKRERWIGGRGVASEFLFLSFLLLAFWGLVALLLSCGRSGWVCLTDII